MRLAPIALSLFLAAAQPVAAACYVDYKAKQDAPLRLHYGVIEVPDAVCAGTAPADAAVAARLAQGGWELLSVVSVFGPEGLETRRGDAGAYFLRF